MRTLIVDDDDDQRRIVARLLDDADIRPVFQAADAEAALGVAADEQPDLIILDLDMPGRSGLDVLPELRERAPGASVVILSNLPRHRLGEAARERGAIGYVEKRVGPDRLVSEILMASAISQLALDGVTVALPADHSSPREARRIVREDVDLGDPKLLPSVELLVSELVTNAVVHASSAPRVEVHVSTASVRVAVHDDDATMPRPRTPDPAKPGGRGLHILDRLASRWGAEPRADGKVVWFEIDRVP